MAGGHAIAEHLVEARQVLRAEHLRRELRLLRHLGVVLRQLRRLGLILRQE